MLKSLCAAATALVLTGCAAFNNLNNEVSTYGPWPVDRKPASFAFERLPSQQAQPQRQQQLEDAARGAVEAVGFSAAADANSAEYLMQLGARVTSNDPWVYNDPLFWRTGYFRYGYHYGHPRWGRGGEFRDEGVGFIYGVVILLALGVLLLVAWNAGYLEVRPYTKSTHVIDLPITPDVVPTFPPRSLYDGRGKSLGWAWAGEGRQRCAN